jgi:hypothetical protein
LRAFRVEEDVFLLQLDHGSLSLGQGYLEQGFKNSVRPIDSDDVKRFFNSCHSSVCEALSSSYLTAFTVEEVLKVVIPASCNLFWNNKLACGYFLRQLFGLDNK